MIISWLTRRAFRKRKIEAMADRLITKYGADHVAREIKDLSRNLSLTDEERAHIYAICAAIEKKLDIKPHADTATRWGGED